MLPNHSPLVVAEQFGTLASLYPGRIDLGWAARRAPTRPRRARCAAISITTPPTAPAGRGRTAAYFDDVRPGQRVRAVPGAGLKVPLWLLGSSLFSAQLRRRWACRSRLLRISRPASCARPWTCIAARSARPSSSTGRT
jgi:alkanesulfonate monooxygenase SsuD/methylene tetrahydromethanopterin reductase-like flavin-dependent oxidoreductase (luciferase family)